MNAVRPGGIMTTVSEPLRGAAVASANHDQIAFARTEISLEAREAAARVLASGWVTSGPEVVEFEREFAAYVGAKYAVAVASCTAAIELALRALRLRPGAKVLTPTLTFCGAVHAIVSAGCAPVLVDCDPATVMPNEATTAAVAARAGGVDAMVVLHYAGMPPPVEALAAAAGLPLERVVDDHVRRARLHGMSRDAWKRYLPGSSWRYEVDTAGIKANLTDVQAAIGRAQLPWFAAWQRRREALAARYQLGLAGIPGLRPAPRPAAGRHAWHLYVVQVEPEFGRSRDDVAALLAGRGIGTSVHFIPQHQQPYFRRLLGEHIAGWFPGADTAFRRILSLPLYPSLS